MKNLSRLLAGYPWQHRHQFLDVVAVRFVRKLVGLSQSALVLGDDGRYYVVRLRCDPYSYDPGPNEYLGHSLQVAMGLPSPRYGRVFLSHRFVHQTPMLWIDTLTGPMVPLTGYCFATEFLGLDFKPPSRVIPLRYTEYLVEADLCRVSNKSDFLGALILDLFTGKLGRRKALFRGRRSLKAYFIGHNTPYDNSSSPKLQGPLHPQRKIYEGLWDASQIAYWITLLELVAPKVVSMAVPFGEEQFDSFHSRLGKAEVSDKIKTLPTLLKEYEEILRHGSYTP